CPGRQGSAQLLTSLTVADSELGLPLAGVKVTVAFSVTLPVWSSFAAFWPVAATVRFTVPAPAAFAVTVLTPGPDSFTVPAPGTSALSFAVPVAGLSFGLPSLKAPELVEDALKPGTGQDPTAPPLDSGVDCVPA